MNDERIFAITMGYDAFRLCLGVDPKNHTYSDVIEWIMKMNAVKKLYTTTRETPAPKI